MQYMIRFSQSSIFNLWGSQVPQTYVLINFLTSGSAFTGNKHMHAYFIHVTGNKHIYKLITLLTQPSCIQCAPVTEGRREDFTGSSTGVRIVCGVALLLFPRWLMPSCLHCAENTEQRES